jgi:hypothetical protein
MYIKYIYVSIISADPICVVGSIRHLMQVQCGVHRVWSTKSTTLTTSGAILCYRTNEILAKIHCQSALYMKTTGYYHETSQVV